MLIENVDKRFEESLPVLSALSVFDPLKVPGKETPGFLNYGKNQLKTLCEHFTKNLKSEDQKQQEIREIIAEFGKYKYDMINMREEIPEACKPENMPCKLTSLQWALQTIVEAAHFYPKLSSIAEAILVVPVSNAWPERGASCLKRIKSRMRSRLSNNMLNALLSVSINGEKSGSEWTTSVIKESVDEWCRVKKKKETSKK